MSTGRRGAGQRGAVMVEAAIILPLLLLILFGIIEWGMAFKNASAVSAATRSGVRIASAQPRQSLYQDSVVQAVDTALGALTSADPLELWIYKANADGTPDGFTDFADCQSTMCWRYTWDSASKSFTPLTGYAWPGSSQNACAGEAEEVGVYLKVRHHFMTNMIGSDRTLADHTVMRLEPIPSTQQCKP